LNWSDSLIKLKPVSINTTVSRNIIMATTNTTPFEIKFDSCHFIIDESSQWTFDDEDDLSIESTFSGEDCISLAISLAGDYLDDDSSISASTIISSLRSYAKLNRTSIDIGEDDSLVVARRRSAQRRVSPEQYQDSNLTTFLEVQSSSCRSFCIYGHSRDESDYIVPLQICSERDQGQQAIVTATASFLDGFTIEILLQPLEGEDDLFHPAAAAA
jgi:hypothetical protein